jgi:uncharacterized membrane protein YccF (DUF307 family)
MASATETTFVDTRRSPNLLIRLLWFLFIGWWASFIVITLAALVNLTVIGIPLGFWLVNRVPQTATLKLDRARHTASAGADGSTVVTVSNVPQRPFWQRALWYLLVGWWLTFIALYLAWALCLTIIGMPLAFPIFSATGKLLTLKRG